jgi:UDPglucose 6-dehydrogenase
MSFLPNVGVVGVGFVGNAMKESFGMKGLTVKCYDKFKDGGIGTLDELIDCEILFLCLPTPYNSEMQEYDKSAIYDVCEELSEKKFRGITVIKSTIEIKTMDYLKDNYPLKYIHNPEFLTAETALKDFHNQSHIVLGIDESVTNIDVHYLHTFYNTYYPGTTISICSVNESEAMKLFCNCFYATKVQLFNELYCLCEQMDISYNNVTKLMIGNGWINPMHTIVPGTDGKMSYGGYCFPKDTNALNELMKKHKTPNAVLNAVIRERNEMREDNENCS